jgi:hypothetical protein
MPTREELAAGDQRQDIGEHLPRHRDLGHLKGHVAAAARHLRADLDQLRDSRDAAADGQFATAETGRAVEGQAPAIHWMAVTSTGP